MSNLPGNPGAVTGLDHVGIVGASLDALARTFLDLGFHLTPCAAHASGRTANRCVMLRDGGYLELMAIVSGQSSATLDGFLARGPGAHILALEVADETAALERLNRANIDAGAVSITERLLDAAVPEGPRARFALLMPPDSPDGRILLIRHLTPGLLWRPEHTVHPNGALALTEAVYAVAAPAETMARLSRLAGRPAEPGPLGGYRISCGRGTVRVLPRAAAETLFPGVSGGAPLTSLTIAADIPEARVVHAGGVAIRFVPASP